MKAILEALRRSQTSVVPVHYEPAVDFSEALEGLLGALGDSFVDPRRAFTARAGEGRSWLVSQALSQAFDKLHGAGIVYPTETIDTEAGRSGSPVTMVIKCRADLAGAVYQQGGDDEGGPGDGETVAGHRLSLGHRRRLRRRR